MEDNPLQACKTSPSGNRIQTWCNYFSTHLGLPDPAKPLTLYMTEKGKVAKGVLSQIMGTWDRAVAYL